MPAIGIIAIMCEKNQKVATSSRGRLTSLTDHLIVNEERLNDITCGTLWPVVIFQFQGREVVRAHQSQDRELFHLNATITEESLCRRRLTLDRIDTSHHRGNILHFHPNIPGHQHPRLIDIEIINTKDRHHPKQRHCEEVEVVTNQTKSVSHQSCCARPSNNVYFFILGEKSSKRKKHKEHQRRAKKSRSKSKQRPSSSPSISSEPALSVASQPRQIIQNTSLAQENIKVILKNEDAIAKRQKLKKREKKNKKEKVVRKEVVEKPVKEVPGKEVSKEVFASGDNILISVCFNNNNNNNNGKSKDDQSTGEQLAPIKTKSKKRQPSPVSSVSSTSFEESERRARKHKRKKVKNKRDRVPSKAPETPPIQITQSKRKSDMKPIAIIDLEKSPGKEVTQSPKEIIVLSDSEGEGKKRDLNSKDVIIIDDIIVIEKNNSNRNHSPTAQVPSQPVLKFALKSKSNILPFNLLHDKNDEVEEQDGNSNSVNDSQKTNPQQDVAANNSMDDKSSNQRDAYDPFEPTKSGSVSPITPPPPNDVSSSSDMMKNKLESPVEKVLPMTKEPTQTPAIGSEEHLISSSSISIWSRKEFEKKQQQQQQTQQPTTPPLPPMFSIFSGSSSTQTMKQHVSLYDGIYGNDLKTPILPSPAKNLIKTSHDEKNLSKNDNDDDRTPYSPSSDGYDFEPPAPENTDKQNDPGSGSSYTFSSNDDNISKTGPLKLTASTLKTFNSTMRSSGPVGLQFVNKTELSIFENYLPASQQKSPLVKRQSSFLRSKISRFTNSLNENGSPAMARGSINYHETLKPPVIGKKFLVRLFCFMAKVLINFIFRRFDA